MMNVNIKSMNASTYLKYFRIYFWVISKFEIKLHFPVKRLVNSYIVPRIIDFFQYQVISRLSLNKSFIFTIVYNILATSMFLNSYTLDPELKH